MSNVIQYVPFTSFVNPSFWYSLSDLKLNHDKLNETTKQIFGKFSYRDDIGTVFEVDGTSYNSDPPSDQYYQTVTGTIMNKNTIEEFKNIDKAALLNSIGEIILSNIRNKTWIDNPSSLINYFVLTFADLKKFHYFYWFAFPSPSQPTINMHHSSSISSYFDKDITQIILEGHKSLQTNQKPFFGYDKETSKILTVSEILRECDSFSQNHDGVLKRFLFGFLDPSNGENPGWSLRILVAALVDHLKWLSGQNVDFIGLRYTVSGSVENSRVYSVFIPENVQTPDSGGWVGWERNEKGNFGPRLANMSASMDPVKLADSQSDLNIRLMKWRLAPELDVDVMKQTRCLLLGAGTLGCHVARDLLAWGFRDITFVDNGKVSFSNPTRQVLFNFEDCLGGGRRKAEAAADSIKRILPTVKSVGINLHIPMPGHPIGESLKTEALSNIQRLIDAIQSHDVIFLLLDTREARWLPTLLASHFGKIAINAALGFDSYLVMRHGVHKDGAQDGGDCASGRAGSRTEMVGGHLGCYFCNDVTAPGNSVRDRTLDQQCTVTRPGVAAIAGALAVELLVGLLQHPAKVDAPAIYNNRQDTNVDDIPSHLQGILGSIPHSIRGFLHSYQNVTPTCEKFKQCIACSKTVVEKFRSDGIDFVMKVCESGKYLEDLTGLSQLQLTAEMAEMLTLTDDDDEFED